MGEFLPQQFHYTTQFFQNNFGTELKGEYGNQILSELLEHLKLDGFDVDECAEGTKHRLLSDAGGGGSSGLVMNLILIFICVLCAGFASGLTQGLLSLDFMEMKIKSQSGTPKEKEYASKLLPVIKHHHLLLVTLMLWNASATEALPIFLDAIVPEYVAIIISVTLVLLFGEIIPASILTGPNQLRFAANLTPLVYFVYLIFFPIAYPIALLLDAIIGHDSGLTIYSKRELATMMTLQHEEGQRHGAGGINYEEIAIIGGALKFRDMKVSEVMTRKEDIFMVSMNETLSYKTIYDIFKAGYSRIPVYGVDKSDIIGLILAKDLIFVDPEDEIPVSNFVEFFSRKPVMVWHDQLLGETLSTFRRERAHLAMVQDVYVEGNNDPYYIVVGIITLEDIIEEILGAEIEDEFDYESEHELSSTLRDMDLARLKSLRSKVTDDKLSVDEIEAITSYLPKQVPDLLSYLSSRGTHTIKDLVLDAQVFVLKRQTPDDSLKPHSSDIIVRKDKYTNSCILILQGKVRLIHYDREEPKLVGSLEQTPFSEEDPESPHIESDSQAEILGPWSIICAEALVHDVGTYAPTFTACIYSLDLRFVRISNVSSSSAPAVTHPRRGTLKRMGSTKGGVTSSRTDFPVIGQGYQKLDTAL